MLRIIINTGTNSGDELETFIGKKNQDLVVDSSKQAYPGIIA